MAGRCLFIVQPSKLALQSVLAPKCTTLWRAGLKLGRPVAKVAVRRLQSKPTPLALAGTGRRCHRVLGYSKSRATPDGGPSPITGCFTKSAAICLEETHGGPLQLQEVVAMALDVLEALAQLHYLHILHLNLKPENIMLDDHGHAYLTDFDTHEAVEADSAAPSTPHYMAPEQLHAEFGHTGTHSDVWAFAACMLHLATGLLPYQGSNPAQVESVMLKGAPPEVPISVPGWLQQILKQCLSFDTAARPSVAHLFQVLQEQQYQLIGVDERATAASQGRFTGLVAQLESGEAATQQQAAQEIAILVETSDSNKCALIAAGIVPVLVALLRPGNPAAQQYAASTVVRLTGQTKGAFIAAGAMPLLLSVLESEYPPAQSSAAIALTALSSGFQQVQEAVVAAGAVPILIGLLKSDQPDVLESGAIALSFFACNREQSQAAIIAAGAVPGLIAVLLSDKPTVHEAAIRLVFELSATQEGKDAITAAGAVPVLVTMLRSHQLSWRAQYLATAIVSALARVSQQSRDAITAAGAVPVMVTLVRSDNSDVQSVAVNNLMLLADAFQDTDINTVADAGPLVVALIYPGQHSMVQLTAVSAVWVLARFTKSQHIMDAFVAAGATSKLTALLHDQEPAVQEAAADAITQLTRLSSSNILA